VVIKARIKRDFRHLARHRARLRLRAIPPATEFAMSQWHLHDTTSNQRLGPMDTDAARAAAARNPSLLAWKDGMGDWLPVRNADEIDYTIYGEDMQFVEIELDPGEAAIAEAGSLMYKDVAVRWTPCSATVRQASRRRLHGQAAGRRQARDHRRKPVHHGVHNAQRQRQGPCAFAAPYPGTIVPMNLSELGGNDHLPEGQLPVRGARRADRHAPSEEDPHRPVRRRGLHHAEARGRWPGVRACRRHRGRTRARRRANASMSTPAAWSAFTPGHFDVSAWQA
jgi:hypothetical protein